MEELDTRGLGTFRDAHPANVYYPDQRNGDFAEDYDPHQSKYPWNSEENCHVCGRLRERLNVHSCKTSHFDPYQNGRVWITLCSPTCKDDYIRNCSLERAYHDRIHINMNT